MKIRSVSLSHLAIPLRVTFKHAQAARSVTDSLWVQVTTDTGVTGHGEACPRRYVTGESADSARAFFRAHAPSIVADIHDLGDLTAWADSHRVHIDHSPAAWCALELALLDAIARTHSQSVADLLALDPRVGDPQYSAVIGDADRESFTSIASRYRDLGITDFKIKLSGDSRRDTEKLDSLRAICGDVIRVRADANNLYPDADSAIEGLRPLRDRLWAVEEPVQARDYSSLRTIHDALGLRIILDESVCSRDDLTPLYSDPERWIVNLRVSKMGGLLRSMEVACRAHGHGLKLIVGAQVGETSLLTRAALLAGMAFPSDVIAREGAFGTLLLRDDVCAPPLMFGKNGHLDATALNDTAGWQFLVQPVTHCLRPLETRGQGSP